VLLAPPNRERLLVAAVKTPGADVTATREFLQDLGLMTGGRPLLKEAGDMLVKVRPDQLGRARRAWADPEYFGILGGRGDPAELRRHVAALRSAYNHADDPRDRKRLLDRLGKLLGGAAVLWVGALSPLAIDSRKEQATRTAEALRGALRDGVVPGGGVALLDCIPALEERYHAAAHAEERAAYDILRLACEAPARALLHNAGFDPSETLACVRQAGPGHGFDVVGRQVVQMEQAGILDAAAVVRAAVVGAIHSAALALTIDVLVHRANPPDSSTNP
jgi:chaperonin GroEL